MKDVAAIALPLLACPQCLSRLTPASSGLRCEGCSTDYPRTTTGSLDLRLQRQKSQAIEFDVPGPSVPNGFRFGRLEFAKRPEVDYSTTQTPWHLTRELLSYFPHALSESSVALDLGCGSGLHRSVCERAGFNWVGVDYGHPHAPILGDGHALPFKSECVDFVLSIAVLEHLQHPAVAMKEVHRILKPGRLFIGTVAFLEPFHGDSYYHHTHLGTYNSLSSAGFLVDRVAANARWSGLQAQATMGGLFPRIPNWLGRVLVWPLELLHKLWWSIGRQIASGANETARLVGNTGSFEFIARKAVARPDA